MWVGNSPAWGKRTSLTDPQARNYTGYSRSGNSIATGDSQDAAQPSGSAAPTASRNDGSVRGDGKHGRISSMAGLAIKRQIKTSIIK